MKVPQYLINSTTFLKNLNVSRSKESMLRIMFSFSCFESLTKLSTNVSAPKGQRALSFGSFWNLSQDFPLKYVQVTQSYALNLKLLKN